MMRMKMKKLICNGMERALRGTGRARGGADRTPLLPCLSTAILGPVTQMWSRGLQGAHQDGQEHGEAKDPPEAHVVVRGPAPAEWRDEDCQEAPLPGSSWRLAWIGSPSQASTKAQNPAHCHMQWCGVTPGPAQRPYGPTCTYLCPVPPSSQQLELVLTGCFRRGTSQ